MSRKKTILLKYVIEEYLRSGEPVGSQSLKIASNLKMSSATIRNYFKAMMADGLLFQPHISSGRIPTQLAFKNHWRTQVFLGDLQCVKDLSWIEKKSVEIGCFISVMFLSDYQLREVQNFQDSFLVLKFSGLDIQEVILRYSAPLERFVQDLIGMGLEDMISFASQIHAVELSKALQLVIPNNHCFFGAKHLASFMQDKRGEKLFFELCNGEVFKKLGNGIFFEDVLPKGFVAFVREAEIAGKKARLLYCGSLERNYALINL